MLNSVSTKEKRTQVNIFVTKSLKFRAKIQEVDNTKYEVTIGGESWNNGKGKAHKVQIMEKVGRIMVRLQQELATF